MSVEALREAWKDFRLDGAEMIFRHGPVSFEEDGKPMECMGWGLGWKCWHEGRKYGNSVQIPAPVFNEVVAEHLKQTYAEFRQLHPS